MFSLRKTNLDNPEYIKFLGVMLDSTLNWNYHVDSICNKIALPSLYIYNCLVQIKANLKYYFKINATRNYNTRINDNLYSEFLRLTTSRNGSNFFGIKFYNKLPNKVSSLPLCKFKSMIKKLLLIRLSTLDEYLSYSFTVNDFVFL